MYSTAISADSTRRSHRVASRAASRVAERHRGGEE
jgi:hypothetical protein